LPGELRDFFDESVVREIARDLKRAYPEFRSGPFITRALDGLAPLSLTGRAAHIADAMREHLPADFPRVAAILERSLGPPHSGTESFGMAPFKYLPHTIIAASDGLDHFEEAMRLQYHLTQRFSAEFSIRAFLNAYPRETHAQLVAWTTDENPHVRRLVSEGTRPRLPWAPRLRHFQADPTPVLELLERLKDDPERYVQRSVANNLNDISKDHPELAVAVCRRWLKGAPAGRAWIVRHALRSLVKGGHSGALTLLGAGAVPKVRIDRPRIAPSRTKNGGRVEVSCELTSTSRSAQHLMIDYAVHYVKANGGSRPKVFKLRRTDLEAGEALPVRFAIRLADLTTRKHYPGKHAVELRINGRPFELGAFELLG